MCVSVIFFPLHIDPSLDALSGHYYLPSTSYLDSQSPLMSYTSPLLLLCMCVCVYVCSALSLSLHIDHYFFSLSFSLNFLCLYAILWVMKNLSTIT